MASRHAGPTMDRICQAVGEDAMTGLPACGGHPRPHPPWLLNVYAVELMRTGKAMEALGVLNEMVLDPRTLAIRRDVPDSFKANLATARLLVGNPRGCLQALRAMRPRDNTAYVRMLRRAVSAWNSRLPLLSRLAWRFGRPLDRPIQLEFVPGDLGE